MAGNMIVSVIFDDGSSVDPMLAASLIGSQAKAGRGLKAIYQDATGKEFPTYVFWSTSGDRFHLLASSGANLFTTAIRRINEMEFEIV